MANQLTGHKVWLVDFLYDTGAVERSEKINGGEEVKVISEGQTSSDLQLRDDIYFSLQDDYEINVTKDASKATGKILIHAIHFHTGGFKKLSVVLEDMQGETIARIKIENGDRRATFKDEDSFSKYSAKAIANTIAGNTDAAYPTSW